MGAHSLSERHLLANGAHSLHPVQKTRFIQKERAVKLAIGFFPVCIRYSDTHISNFLSFLSVQGEEKTSRVK